MSQEEGVRIEASGGPQPKHRLLGLWERLRRSIATHREVHRLLPDEQISVRFNLTHTSL